MPFMKKTLFSLFLAAIALTTYAQDPFTDFFGWRESFRYDAGGAVVTVTSDPGREVYFLSVEKASQGAVAVRLQSDMTVLFESVPGYIIPEGARQEYVSDGDEEGSLKYVYQWESGRTVVERNWSGPEPDDMASYPSRKVGNGAGVYDPLMIMTRLRCGGDLADLVDATVVYAGKSYYVTTVRRTLGYGDDGTVSKYVVTLTGKSHIGLTVENEGYRRPTAFDVKIGDRKLKGKLVTE